MQSNTVPLELVAFQYNRSHAVSYRLLVPPAPKTICGVSFFPRGWGKPLSLCPLRPGRGWLPPSPGALFSSRPRRWAVGVRRGGQRDLQCSAETQSKVKNAPARLLRQRQPSIPGALPTVCKKSSRRASSNSQIRCRNARLLPSGQG